jgi:hypothetical protein
MLPLDKVGRGYLEFEGIFYEIRGTGAPSF